MPLEYLELIPSMFRVEHPRYKVLKEHGITSLDLSLELCQDGGSLRETVPIRFLHFDLY